MRTTKNKIAKYQGALERLREGVSLRGGEAIAHGDFSRWGFWIASAIIASQIALLCYKVSSPFEQHSQFVAAQIAWRAASKSRDYNLLLGIIFGFLAALLMLLTLTGRIRKRIAPIAVADFHTLIVFASLPAIVWCGRLFLTRDTSFSLLTLSALLVELVMLFAVFSTLKDIKSDSSAHFSDFVTSSVLILIWSVLSGLAIVFAVSRLAIVFRVRPRSAYPKLTLIAILAALSVAAAFLTWAWSRRATAGEALAFRLRRMVLVAQGFAPCFFLILLPAPWIKNGRRFYGYPMKPTVWIAIGLLVVVAYVDLVRRWKSRPSSNESYVTSALSPICLVSLLLFIKVAMIGGPAISPDDYHFGEFLLPWWSWSVHHMIPFWDFAPARGLVNYVPGFLSAALFDGMPASFGTTVPFTAAAFLVLCYLVVARSIGVFPTFLAFLLMPLANGISEIDMLVTAALCALAELYLRAAPRSAWLIAWISVGIIAVLFAPGQGGLLVIATLPLGLIATHKALKHERERLLKFVAVLTVTLVALSIFTPLGKMLAGAIRYGIEQSSINSIANGIEWSQSWWNVNGQITNLWLWESARASWILVAIVAGVLTIRSALERKSDRSKRLIVFAVPIFILMVVFIFRAAGRIGAAGMDRLGIASIWALALLLPILLIAAYGKERRALVLATTSFLAAIVSPYFAPLNLEGLFSRPGEVIEMPINVVKGSELNLPNLGTAIVAGSNLKRMQSINHVLNLVVEPGETYLDLTNRSSLYFYLGFRPAIETGAVYNLVNESQQLRAIRDLKRRPPPIIVASADSILHDGITSAYRTYLLYRYVTETYVPVSFEGLIYMVRPDRLSRVAQYIDVQGAMKDESRLLLLDAVFRMDDIGAIPVAWGRSLKTLAPQLRQVQGVGLNMPPLLNSVSDIGNGYYRIDRLPPSLTFDISTWSLSGKDAGILTFDFSCRGNTDKSDIKMRLSSSATTPNDLTAVQFVAQNGPLVVPLDAAPRWLLAKGINSLSFELIDPGKCSEFSVTNIKLWQRTSVDKLPN